jgi:hypothetical protein
LIHIVRETGKVFANGRSQAIRLPKEFCVKGDQVILKRVPEGILIIERDSLGHMPASVRRTVIRVHRRTGKARSAIRPEERLTLDIQVTYILDSVELSLPNAG